MKRITMDENGPHRREFTSPPFPPLQGTYDAFTLLLVALLLIASFLLGMLVTKVESLSKNGVEKANAQTLTPQGTDPSPTPVPGNIRPVTENDHMEGNKNAKITVVEYSDLECPFCKQFHPTWQQLVKDYGNRVRFVFRHYPLPFHQNAEKEAEGAECITEQGGNNAFWKYTDTIFSRTTSNGLGFALDKLGPLAHELGYNQNSFQSCLDSGKYAKTIQDEIADGAAGGVSGTPSIFISSPSGKYQLIVGAQPLEVFKTILDQNLK